MSKEEEIKSWLDIEEKILNKLLEPGISDAEHAEAMEELAVVQTVLMRTGA